MAGGITIRPGRASDAAAVLPLWTQAALTASVTDTLEDVATVVGNPAAVRFVAVDGESVVGSVIV